MAGPDDADALFDAYCARTRELTGKRVSEWEPWNTEATADAIRHFALGTDDDNPLWLDADYAAETPNGTIVAPPCFLISVSYPILHGACMKPPLSSLIGGLEIEWFALVRLGDRISAEPVQKDFHEKRNKAGRRLGFVISEVGYRNQRGALVGRATGTLIIMGAAGEQPSAHAPVQRYGPEEIAALDAAMASETRTGGGAFHFEDVAVGNSVPPIVRGPFTVGDLVCWYAAAGPGWRPGRLGRIELNESPHLAIANPLTGGSGQISPETPRVRPRAGRRPRRPVRQRGHAVRECCTLDHQLDGRSRFPEAVSPANRKVGDLRRHGYLLGQRGGDGRGAGGRFPGRSGRRSAGRAGRFGDRRRDFDATRLKPTYSAASALSSLARSRVAWACAASC